MRARSLMITVGAFAVMAALRSAPADAGCGCNKPPPVMAMVRPAFASPGDAVTLFPPDNKSGKYEVRFSNGKKEKEIKDVRAVYKRDLGDGLYKWQVVVPAPQLSAGPTSIEMKGPGKDLKVASTDFTMMQPALALQEGDGETLAKCYSAAVTADHTVLIPLDVSAIDDHMIFNGLGENYPLLFGAADVTIYNAQGFLMQLLTPENAGIYALQDPGDPDSIELTYDRHEFITYRQQHAHVDGFGLDPADPAWHVDGTYHVDHDHLVIAIKGNVENQGPPPAGKTPNFDFSIVTALADTTVGPPTTRTITWSNACGSTSSGLVGTVTGSLPGHDD
jgi:hypothetical protein